MTTTQMDLTSSPILTAAGSLAAARKVLAARLASKASYRKVEDAEGDRDIMAANLERAIRQANPTAAEADIQSASRSL